MVRIILQVLLLLLLTAFCISGYFLVDHFLDLPFRTTNDNFHKNESPITLDFLIPSGTHIDEKMTIGEVLEVFADDPAAESDIQSFTKRTGHKLLKLEKDEDILRFLIEKAK